ncbi:hypothetical protein DFR67_102267 [Williamsia limnetica]|uniref:Signal transduction histidine kinase n=1 Tax=Williamsia limnetica TaxID=882452 RepID=A0A318RUP2_WILLI|nr:hypothetical protein [Williamsia limnetica]PYE20129.1 hypothetical protein DFR67_102267 [Williamsia limnetica]
MTPFSDPADVRDILGLRTTATRVIVVAVLVAMAFGASQSVDGISPVWPVVIVVGIMAAATIALVAVPSDPLPLGPAILMALAPPVSAAILLSVVPVPLATTNQVWISGYATLIYVFMALRGRILTAWLSVAASAGVHAWWAAETGQEIWAGAQIPLYNAGALLPVTLIALAIRKTTRSILLIRAQARQRAADASMITAAGQERNARLAELDELARPLLLRIATGVPLTAAERQDCELLEAHLRDQLRAAALVSPTTAAAAREARARGVEVTLIDDGGLDVAYQELRNWVHVVVTAALEDAHDGHVRIRVLPAGRHHVVTLYRSGSSGTERIRIERKGLVERHSDAEHPGRNTPHLITPANHDPSAGVTTKDVYLRSDPEV